MKRSGFGLSCTWALGVLAPVQGHAQTGAESQGASVEEIIITARKSSENLQRAAISVTAINMDTIERSGVKDPTDLQSRMPGVEFQTATSVPGVSIRGIGTYNLQSGVDAAVAYSIDDIYLARPQAFPPVLVDIAQVEVVRGPQGTLYGRNSNGGAISFRTNKPELGKLGAALTGTVGNYSTFGSEAMLNVPLGDKAAIRGAFGSNNRDGYYENGYGDANDWAARVRLLLQPADSFDFALTADRSRLRNAGATSDACPPRSSYAICQTTPFRPWTGLDGRDPTDFVHIDIWSIYGEANLTLNDVTVTSLTSYRHTDWLTKRTDFQFDSQAGFIQGLVSKLFTQELRIASSDSSALRWLVGGYYSHESGPGRMSLEAGGADYFISNPELEMESKALFGQVTYSVTDSLRLTGGIRYTMEEKSATGPVEVILAASQTFLIDHRTSLDKVTWKAGFEYDVAPDSLLYGSVSTGFKSGGVNQVPNHPAFSPVYEPETITAYQIGSKNRFFSNSLQINAEFFYYDYRNFQTLQIAVDPSGEVPGFFAETANSQKATLYGGEIEAILALSRVDTLTASLTLLHNKFDRFLVGGTDLSGKHLQAAPPYAVAVSYQHIFELGNGGEIILGADSQLVGAHYMDNSNISGSYQTTYTRSGASLTYQDRNRNWTVSLFIRNIEDRAVIATYAPSFIGPGDTATLYPPRVFGALLGWKY